MTYKQMHRPGMSIGSADKASLMKRVRTCDVEIRDWSWRAVRSEEDTLAGAPLWSLMLTFLSRSAREMARGDVFPKQKQQQMRPTALKYTKLPSII